MHISFIMIGWICKIYWISQLDDTYVINPIELADVYVYSYNTEIAKGGYLDFNKGEKGVIADILDVPSSGINAYIDMDVEYEMVEMENI